MSLSALLLGAYLVMGVVVAAVIAASDYCRRRLSVSRIISELAFLSPVAFLLWADFWPLWAALLLLEPKVPESRE